MLIAVMNFKLPFEKIKKLVARMHVRTGVRIVGARDEFGKIGVHVPVGNHIGQTLKVIGRGVHTGLRQTHALFAAMDLE